MVLPVNVVDFAIKVEHRGRADFMRIQLSPIQVQIQLQNIRFIGHKSESILLI